jgi:hypothetical protein
LRGTGLRLYAITNWSQYTFPYGLARYPFLQWFDDIIVSGREGMVKPHPAIFGLLLSRSGIEAGRSVFIDDTPKNVEGAGLLGFQTLLFRSAPQLRRDLGNTRRPRRDWFHRAPQRSRRSISVGRRTDGRRCNQQPGIRDGSSAGFDIPVIGFKALPARGSEGLRGYRRSPAGSLEGYAGSDLIRRDDRLRME